MQTRSALTAETRRILALAWPVVLTSLNWTILHVTDVVVVGLAGTHEAAALGASRTLTFVGLVMAIGALSGVLVHVSRADGAKDLRGTGRVFHEGLILAGAIGLVIVVPLFVFAETLLLLFGVEPGIAPAAAVVVRIIAAAMPFQLLIITASFFLEGVSKPRRVTAINLAVLPVNALLAWILASGQLGLPAFGAAGAASATLIASALGGIGMLAAAWTLPGAVERGVRDVHALLRPETTGGALRLARFGAMPALSSGLELAGFSILIALSTRLGEDVAHAFQIVFSTHNVTFSLALGLGSAAGVRAGNAVGEGVPEQAASRAGIAATLAAASIGALALVILAFPHALVSLFPASARVHAVALAMLPLWVPFILFDGVQVVFVYALRSLGDQVVAGVNSILAYFVVTGGAGLLFVHWGLGPSALVWASVLGFVAAALLHGGRLWWISRRFRSRS